jgi:uncharacterized protein YjiS (DUF1127 family)
VPVGDAGPDRSRRRTGPRFKAALGDKTLPGDAVLGRRAMAEWLVMAMLLAAPMAQQPVAHASSGRYRSNQDYHLPRNAETIMWGSFMLDHAAWPKRREVGVSKTGLVIVLDWQSQTRARWTLLRMAPHELRDFFDLLETRVGLCSIKSVPDSNLGRPGDTGGAHEPYYLYATLGYALPSRSESTCAVYEDASTKVAPLVSVLRSLVDRAADAWRHDEQRGGPVAGTFLDTADPDFLPHFLSVLHENQTLQEIPSGKQVPTNPAPN